MNILIIGGGGREHALAWKAVADPSLLHQATPVPAMAKALQCGYRRRADRNQLVEFARANAVGLTIVGPEVPLVPSVVDAFNRAGLNCFRADPGSRALRAQKAFTKDFLKRHRIPTAAYGSFTDQTEALAYLHQSRGADSDQG